MAEENGGLDADLLAMVESLLADDSSDDESERAWNEFPPAAMENFFDGDILDYDGEDWEEHDWEEEEEEEEEEDSSNGVLTESQVYQLDKARNDTSNELSIQACAVCIEDFDSESTAASPNILTLPCRHKFHSECIMPWLTRKKGECPLCKDNVLSRLFCETAHEES